MGNQQNIIAMLGVSLSIEEAHVLDLWDRDAFGSLPEALLEVGCLTTTPKDNNGPQLVATTGRVDLIDTPWMLAFDENKEPTSLIITTKELHNEWATSLFDGCWVSGHISLPLLSELPPATIDMATHEIRALLQRAGMSDDLLMKQWIRWHVIASY